MPKQKHAPINGKPDCLKFKDKCGICRDMPCTALDCETEDMHKKWEAFENYIRISGRSVP